MDDIMSLIEQSEAGVVVDSTNIVGVVPEFKTIGWEDLTKLSSDISLLKMNTDISSKCLVLGVNQSSEIFPVVVKSNTQFLKFEKSTTSSVNITVVINKKNHTLTSIITKDVSDGYLLHCIYGNGTFDKHITLFKSVNNVYLPIVLRTHKNEEQVLIDRTLIDDIDEGTLDLEYRDMESKITDEDMVICSNVNHKISKLASTTENVGVLLNKMLEVMTRSNDPKYIDLLRSAMFSLAYTNTQPG